MSSTVQRTTEPEIASHIVEKVAEKEGVDPLTLTPPLHSVVDPDSLNRLFAGSTQPTSIQFTYHGYHIKITGKEDITVSETE